MPVITLTSSDCEALRVALNVQLRNSQADVALASNGSTLDNGDFIQVLRRLMKALEAATTVGTFDPAIALRVLSEVGNSAASFLRSEGRLPEEINHAILLHACEMLEGHRDHHVGGYGRAARGPGF